MTDDIVTRLREKYAGQLPICTEAVDEIERLRTMLAHGLTMGYTCEGCAICDDLKTFHNQVLTHD